MTTLILTFVIYLRTHSGKWFAIESCRQSKSVRDLLLEMKPMAEQINSDSHEVFLFGILPNCGLYGSIDPTGQSHT